MNLNELFHTLDIQVNEEIPSSGTYIHTPQGLTLRPAGDSIWDDDKNNPSEVNVSKIEIGLTNDGPNDIYHFMGVYHDAGTWELYTDNGITEQLNKYLGLAPDSIDWSEQGQQQEDMMHFDIASDEIVKTLINSGKFKMTNEDDMSTGTVAVGKKGKTRRATGIGDNPYDHNEGEDQTALVNAALWNIKDVYQSVMSDTPLEEDDMFSYQDLVQYLEQADMPNQYSQFWDLVTDAIDSAGGFAGQGDEITVDKNIAPQIKTLYQQFKAATSKIQGVKEQDELKTYRPTETVESIDDILRLSGIK